MGAFLDTYFLLCVCLIWLFFSSSSLYIASPSFSSSSSCKLRRKFQLNEVHKPGDVVLGGLFEVHYTSVFPEQTFTSEPQQPICKGFDTLGFRHAMTMAFAIDEINKNSNLLPNVTLGFHLYDNCATLVIGFSGALSLASGREEQFLLQENCLGTPPVLGIVGDPHSTFTIATSNVLGLYKMPIVSYFATCSCLSDRKRFPSFFRTIPSDAFQVRAMIQILKRFGWTWAGLLVTDDDYGLNVARSFQSDLAQSGGGCLAYLQVLPWDHDPSELRRIVDAIKKSTARVVIVFAHETHMINLMEEVVRQNATGQQWIASEAWTAATVLQTPQLMPYLAGTLGIAIRRGEIPGLREFLLQISPYQNDVNNENNMLVHYLQKVNFTTPFGDEVSFDENGDAIPIYDIMNWLWLPDGRTKVQNVGEVKRSDSKATPVSVQVRTVLQDPLAKGKKGNLCAVLDCHPCSEGKISIRLGLHGVHQFQRTSGPVSAWTTCVPRKRVSSYNDLWGGSLACVQGLPSQEWNSLKWVCASSREGQFLVLTLQAIIALPAYVNSPGKYADAVEVFAILASSFGLLLALFGPKCFIILLRPERNTKKAIMGRGTIKS
ncbi:vomeronasal type-2 receptor 1-like [Morone saxatilis]|uniref:vomeronasal type-2 receptor 1-like n=1 Tax=Morone saxatilis TaxID=34816 RepID=UPI0015E1FB73|nr:vomeronasal type-2 receptor 1-like [Morone saxatilis]